jgi:hypothetical protein
VNGETADPEELYAVAREHSDLGRYKEALGCFRELLDAPDLRVLRPALYARALLGQAHCVYETEGDLAAATRLLDDAEAVCHDHALAVELVAVHGQRGLLWLRSGDVARARVALDRAAPRVDDQPSRDAAVLLLNRGALHLDAGALDAAEVDLRESALHAAAVGDRSVEGKALHNLGYAHFLRGDLPEALRSMARAAESFAGETPEPVALLDRSRVLYEAGLVHEAAEMLETTSEHLAAAGATVDLAHVSLDRARCLVQLGRHEEAVTAASSAREAFTAQSNLEWARRAELVELDARLGESRTEDRRHVSRRAEAIAGEGSGLAPGLVTVPARLLQAEAAVAAGDLEAARTALDVSVDDTSLALSVRMQRRVVAARMAFAEGDRARGLEVVRDGHDLLSAHRAQLGSVDAVTAAAAHGARLAWVDVRAALATGLADAVFDATERGRAAFAGAARVRPPEDPELVELLSRARRASDEARELGLGGLVEQRDGVRRMQEARQFQEQARQRSWQLSGSVDGLVPRPATVRSVAARLASAEPGAAMVSFVLADRVMAVRVDPQGARLVELCSPAEVTELARKVRQDLEVLANRLIPAPMRQVAATSARRSLGRLDDLLLRPLGAAGPLDVAARDDLLSLPWSSMPSRAGLATRVHSWVDLREPSVAPRPGGALVVAGPGLEAAEQEAGLVAGEWDGALLLVGEAATSAATTRALGDATVVHLAAHGVHEPDNPLFSCVRLADGPLFAHELDGVDLAGAVVVLSACEVGRASTRVGGEPLGLKSVLLRLGARAVIASVAPLRDDVAARVMPRLHAALVAGVPPSRALAVAVADEPEPVPLVCYGPVATT